MRVHANLISQGMGVSFPNVILSLSASVELSASPRIAPPAPVDNFTDSLLVVVPALRAYAISMVRSMDRADDLVQETLLKAWTNRHRYEEGTNLRGWLFTILRNTLFSQYRKRKSEVEDPDGKWEATLSTPASQDGHMDLDDFKVALAELPSEQRDALILVGGSGFTYEEAAEICGCAVGTIKSRVNRARGRLEESLDIDPVRPGR